MKLNELKQPSTLNEDLSDWIGTHGAASVKGGIDKFKGNAEGSLSTVDRMARDGFIKDFIGRASANIKSAIASGIVVSPAAGQATPAAPVAPETPEQKRIRLQKIQQQTLDKSGGQFDKLPTTAQAETPEQKRIRLQKIQQQTQTGTAGQFSKLPANQVATQSSNIRAAKQLAAAPQTTEKPMVAPVQTPAEIRAAKLAAATAALRESATYNKLNVVFESMMEASSATSSVSSYLQKMFTQYMHGVDTSSQSAKIKELSDAVEQSYSLADGGKAAIAPLTQLANLGFALSHSNKGRDAVASPAIAAGEQPGFLSGLSQGAASSPVSQGASTAPSTPYAKAKAAVTALDNKGRQRIGSLIQKSLATPNAALAPAADRASAEAAMRARRSPVVPQSPAQRRGGMQVAEQKIVKKWGEK